MDLYIDQSSNDSMASIREILTIMSYFAFDVETNTMVSYQKGVFRTNCLDCLDRTNVFQSRLAWKFMHIIVYLMTIV